ncbi:hypothetical protein G6F65_018905 [Rhizopus arrhizus]|nr:hypothetical protein G6F65_018905 [Rhizopus arrhizus]
MPEARDQCGHHDQRVPMGRGDDAVHHRAGAVAQAAVGHAQRGLRAGVAADAGLWPAAGAGVRGGAAASGGHGVASGGAVRTVPGVVVHGGGAAVAGRAHADAYAVGPVGAGRPAVPGHGGDSDAGGSRAAGLGRHVGARS